MGKLDKAGKSGIQMLWMIGLPEEGGGAEAGLEAMHRCAQRDDPEAALHILKGPPADRWRTRTQAESGRISLGIYDTKEKAHATYFGAQLMRKELKSLPASGPAPGQVMLALQMKSSWRQKAR